MIFDVKNLAENIRELRMQNNLSQRSFGEKFDVSQKEVSHWETGFRVVPTAILVKICLEFDIAPNEIFGKL